MGKRELKRGAVREQVFRAAMELFRTKGFDATSIQEIATAAGISQRTLFRYFPTKADIALVPTWENFKHLCKNVRSRPPSESVFEAVQTATLEHAAYLQTRADYILEMQKMRAANLTLEQRRSYLINVEFSYGVAQELAARDGLDAPTPIHVVAAHMCLCLLSVGIELWLDDQERPFHDHLRGLIGSINEEFRAVT